MRWDLAGRAGCGAGRDGRGPRPIGEAVAELLGTLGLDANGPAERAMPRNERTWAGGRVREPAMAPERSLRAS